MPSHGAAGCGSFQRRSPIGGAAYGMPLKIRTFPSALAAPRTAPAVVFTCALAAPAVHIIRVARAIDRKAVGMEPASYQWVAVRGLGGPLVRRSGSALIPSQRCHRLDPRRAGRGHEAGDDADRGEQNRDG